MADLAREIGMSKKTLYASFSSKRDLIEAVLRAKLSAVDADLERITARLPANRRPALQQLLACVQKHTGEIQPAMVRDLERETPDLFAIVEERRRKLIERHFGKALGTGRTAGLLRKGVSPRLVLEILLASVTAVVNPPKLEQLGLTPQAAVTGILGVILEGALSAKMKEKM